MIGYFCFQSALPFIDPTLAPPYSRLIFFFTVQVRGLLPSLCFTYSSLTERSSLLAALPFLAEVRCPPHLAPTSKQWVTLAGGPRSAAPQMPSRAQQLPEGVRAELHPESAT